MERLTDRKTAAALKENAEKLQAAGFEVDISNLRYIKLAEYEDAEELQERFQWLKENPCIVPLKFTGTNKMKNIPECIDEIHDDPTCYKEALNFYGLDEPKEGE